MTGAVTQVSAALRAVLERESSQVEVSGSIPSLVLSSPYVHDTETMNFEYNQSSMFFFFCSSPDSGKPEVAGSSKCSLASVHLDGDLGFVFVYS